MNEFYYRPAKTLGQNLFCCPCSALVTDLTGIIYVYLPKRRKTNQKKCVFDYKNSFHTFTIILGQEVASYWYSTVRRYNYFKDIGLLHTNVNAGHFTQMVWVNTKYFGIAKATSQTGKIFVVAFYYPPGKLYFTMVSCIFQLEFRYFLI